MPGVFRHSGESRNPAFLRDSGFWTPAFAGVTRFGGFLATLLKILCRSSFHDDIRRPVPHDNPHGAAASCELVVMRSSAKRNRTSGQKKILRAIHPKDCTLFHLVLWRFIGYLAYRFPKRHQAGLLTHGSSYSPSLPISFSRVSGLTGFRPRSQRRDRSRFARDSLLNSNVPDGY